jgi:hypothetical protein
VSGREIVRCSRPLCIACVSLSGWSPRPTVADVCYSWRHIDVSNVLITGYQLTGCRFYFHYSDTARRAIPTAHARCLLFSSRLNAKTK